MRLERKRGGIEPGMSSRELSPARTLSLAMMFYQHYINYILITAYIPFYVTAVQILLTAPTLNLEFHI